MNILLGPGLNIKRSPLCGRNFEYFAEDPYLAGKMAAAYVRGIQSQGVYACPKHYAVNSQELRRMAMDSIVDERTLREIYLTGFEIALKESNAGAIMTSYNQVNGVYANENEHLLKNILREEWGFQGVVITDWGASNNHAEAVRLRSNLEMPAPGLDAAREVISAVENGRITEEELNQCVDDLLDAVLVLSENAEKRPNDFDKQAHHELARKAAVESAVLLKNEDGILPLKSDLKVAVIGDFAVEPRYQGAGSSMVNPTALDTIANVIGEYNLNVAGISRGYQRNGAKDPALKQEAVKLAEKADIVIFCFGLDELSESEGLDRMHMKIPENQLDLLCAMAKVNSRIVGVLSAGSAVELGCQSQLKGILHGYLNGQAGARAILDLLTGRENPSGHLNETYPFRYEDTPAAPYFPSKERTAEYREGIYVGYRYYDTAQIPVLYPFGYGLSYTSFTYRDLKADRDGVTLTVENTGKYDGAEVVQLYVGLKNAKIFRPKKELKGFKKVYLKAGESKTVTIPFDDKTFRYWNVKTDKWEIEKGRYTLMAGSNAADIRLTAELDVEGTTDILPYRAEKIPSYYQGTIQCVSETEFEEILGYPVPDGKWSCELGLNDAICQMGNAKSFLARMIYRVLTNLKKKSEEKGKPDLNVLFIYNMPFRGIAKMTGGAVSMEMVKGMVLVVNGHFFSGMKKLVSGYFANRRLNREYEKKLQEE